MLLKDKINLKNSMESKLIPIVKTIEEELKKKICLIQNNLLIINGEYVLARNDVQEKFFLIKNLFDEDIETYTYHIQAYQINILGKYKNALKQIQYWLDIFKKQEVDLDLLESMEKIIGNIETINNNSKYFYKIILNFKNPKKELLSLD